MPEPLDAFQDLTDRLIQCVKVKLREKLKSQLDYADLNDVHTLCVRQLRYGALSRGAVCQRCDGVVPVDRDRWIKEEAERISQEALGNPYVHDSESVAQYLQDKGAERRIREEYWQKYSMYVETTVRAVLTHRYCKREAEARLPQVQCEVEEKVFTEAGFQKVAEKYKADGGMTFDRFLKQLILWRTQETTRQDTLNVIEGELPECEDNAISETGAVEERTTGQEHLSQALQECLEKLRSQHSRGPDRGRQECAVFELRFVALRPPDEMMSLLYVMKASGREEAFFVTEYEAAIETSTELEHELTRAQLDRDRTRRAADVCRRALENAGYTLKQIDALCAEALRDTLEEMKECGKFASDSRQKELQLMASYRRYERAKRKLESLLTGYWKRSVRSEGDIGKLLGLSQATASRRLKAASKSLRECLASKGLTGREGSPV